MLFTMLIKIYRSRHFNGRRYTHEVALVDDGLVFRNITYEKSYRWDDIRNIIFNRTNCVSVIDKDGHRDDGKINLGKSIKKQTSTMEAIYNRWAECFFNEGEINEFEYPFEEQGKEKYLSWFGVVTGTVALISAIYFLFTPSTDQFDKWLKIFFYVPLCLVGALLIISSVLDLWSGTKIISRISIDHDKILIRYANDKFRTFNKNDLYSYSFNHISMSCGVLIVFKGGATIKHLEKVNYFPILRKQILEMMNKSIVG